MPFNKGNEIGRETRWQRGVSPNPGGRPCGSANLSTRFKARVLSRLEDVLCGRFGLDEFVADFEAELGRLIKKSPIQALNATRFLWPVEAPEETAPARLFNLTPERIRTITAAYVASLPPAPTTDAVSLDAGDGGGNPNELNRAESRKPETSAPPVAKSVVLQGGTPG